MADAMKGVTKAMKSMNRQINMPAIQKIMMDFERESEMMDMKEEMMSDAIDEVMDEEEDEEESDQIVQQVFDEIGIGLDQQVSLTGRSTRLEADLSLKFAARQCTDWKNRRQAKRGGRRRRPRPFR